MRLSVDCSSLLPVLTSGQPIPCPPSLGTHIGGLGRFGLGASRARLSSGSLPQRALWKKEHWRGKESQFKAQLGH